MELSLNGIKEQEAWEKAGIILPGYDVEAVSEKAKKEPGWVHFGIGNIFRVFIGGNFMIYTPCFLFIMFQTYVYISTVSRVYILPI